MEINLKAKLFIMDKLASLETFTEMFEAHIFSSTLSIND